MAVRTHDLRLTNSGLKLNSEMFRRSSHSGESAIVCARTLALLPAAGREGRFNHATVGNLYFSSFHRVFKF